MSVNNVALCFICHSTDTAKEWLTSVNDCFILFVGDKVCDISDSRIIQMRNLPNNIEKYKRLLTFTAWYAIVKNDLFMEYSHICLLEYDVSLETTFRDKVKPYIDADEDCISFLMATDNGRSFMIDINIQSVNAFLKGKGGSHITPPARWYPTTNHCIKRSVLHTFVDWYFPDCLYFFELGSLSWYHERLFSVWLNRSVPVIRCLTHKQANSHAPLQIRTPAVHVVRRIGIRRSRQTSQIQPVVPPPLPIEPKILTFVISQMSLHNGRQGYWGLGDIMRGLIAIYQHCKQHRYEFRIGRGNHPILPYLDLQGSMITDIPKNITVQFAGGDGCASISDKDITSPYIFSNIFCKEPLLDDECALIRSVLTIKKEYRITPPKSYNLFHFRFNDSVYMSTTDMSSVFADHVKRIRKHYTPGDILITNCEPFKQYVCDTLSDILIWNKACGGHSGVSSSENDLTPNIIDLQLASHAQTVFTYSDYAWVSGFVNWPTKAYKIPLVDLKLNKL
jgi:hypothetical protein